MADNLIPPALRPRGSWSPTTIYDPGDIIIHDNASYLSIAPSIGDEPPSPSWQTLAAPSISFNLRGDWSRSIPYEPLDVVTYQGEAWACREANINQTPKEGRYWQQLLRIRSTSGLGIGTTGPAGPAGPAGPPGGNYVHDQVLASAIWTVTHNLGIFPNITTVDSTGEEVVGEVAYIDSNSMTVTFTAPFSGKGYVS